MIYANAYQTQKLYTLSIAITTLSLSHTMMRKCVPHTTYYTFLLWLMIYANAHQTKALLFSISLTLTHMMWYTYANAYHTQNITHTVYSVSRLCSLSCAYTHIEYFHVYMLIRICVREGLQGRTRDFRLREKKMVPEILYLDWADYCHNGVHVYKVLWWVDSQK